VIPSEIESYCVKHSSLESPLLRQLREETTQKWVGSQMVSGPHMAAFIQSLVQARDVRRALDIGTYTGYSAAAIAEAFQSMDQGTLQKRREVITLEKSKEAFEFSTHFFEVNGLSSYIRSYLGEAKTLLEGLSGEFDFIFIDADKASTRDYYEWGLRHLTSRGVMIIDDVLWQGKVLDPSSDKRAKAMHELNEFLTSDNRVWHVLIPIRHGVQLIIKKPFPFP
jgi:caffeoyl-CoA O-methyltransferase